MDKEIQCVSYHVLSPKGYPMKISIDFDTMKAMDLNAVMAVFDTIESQFDVRGYKPDQKIPAERTAKKPPEYVEGRECPICKGKLVYQKTKQGITLIKCENSGYDFKTRQPTGCSFVEWPPRQPLYNQQKGPII